MSKDPYAGMTPRETWERSAVHKASTYSCAKCGKAFAGPHDLYDHLDAEHPKERRTRKPPEEPKGKSSQMNLKGADRYVPGQAKSTRRKLV